MIVSVERAAECLRGGAAVAYPTETVYGLGADARSPDAVALVRRLKGRDAAHAISVLVADLAHAERLCGALPPLARRLAAGFWPGPLTLVVPIAVPSLAGVASPLGVGLRCSSHPTALALVRATGCPILSTSCNRSGEPPCLRAEQVEQSFGRELLVAGGEEAGGEAPSTVVAVAEGRLEVLREGALAPIRLLELARR